VVEELADLLAQALGVDKPRDLLRVHPLQPWSLNAFEDETRRPFDPTWAEAARAQQGERRLSGLAATPSDAQWPPETEPPTTLTARELARALENAPRAFLEKTLGISMRDKDTAPEDREPIELDIVANGEAGGDGSIDAGQLFTRRQGEGLIPFEAGGEAVLADELARARSIVDEARKVTGVPVGAASHACAVVAHGCAPLTVTAVIPDVRADEAGARRHVWTTASSVPNDKLKLEAWLAMLVARVADAPVVAAHVIARKGKPVFNAPDKAEALRVLEACVDLWWRLRRQPVLLVPCFSERLAEIAEKDPALSPQALVREGLDAWFEDDSADTMMGADKAMKDDAARALFGGWTEADLEARAETLSSLAQTVWSPLRAATVKPASKKGKKP
jgi:exonuclease V gamma subunit